MTKPGKTPKKKTKEKSPQRTEESEYPAMDEETYNRLLRNAIEQSKAELQAELQQQHKEQLKAVEEGLTKKFDDEDDGKSIDPSKEEFPIAGNQSHWRKGEWRKDKVLDGLTHVTVYTRSGHKFDTEKLPDRTIGCCVITYFTDVEGNKIVGHKGRNTGNFRFLTHPRATNRYTYFQPRDSRDYVPLDVFGIGAENFGFITMGLLSRDTPDPLPGERPIVNMSALPVKLNKDTKQECFIGATTVGECLSKGANPVVLRENVRNGTISIGGSDSSEAVRKALAHGSNLYVTEEDLLHDPRIAHRTEDMLAAAADSNLLFDIPLPDLFNAGLHSLRTKSGGEEWRPDIDVELEKASELLKDPYDDARIFLQLQADDIEYKPEEIGGLKEYPPDQRDAMIAAIMKEIGDLCKIGVFSLEVIPDQSKPLSTKLVLKIKRDADGTYRKHKARLVVRGFLARSGLDYYATYSPMSSLITARTLMAIAVHHHLPIAHADIPQAFVQAELERLIYVKFPRGVYVKSKIMNQVMSRFPNARIGLRLLKSLYGLKNAPMYWNVLLHEHLTKLEFERSKVDTCLYVYRNSNGKWAMIAVSVDDLLITGTDRDKIEKLRVYLDVTFSGEGAYDELVNSFLGINCDYDLPGGILAMDIAQKFRDLFKEHPILNQFKGSHAPWLSDFKSLDEDIELKMDEPTQYLKDNFASIVGLLIYCSISCRPDLTTIVNKACKGMHGPERRHILYLKAALKYINYNKDRKLIYKRNGGPIRLIIEKLENTYPELNGITDAPIYAFSDASHMGLIKDKMRSCTGSAIFTFHCLTQWYHGGQSIASNSTLQSELIGASTTADKAAWFYHFMKSYPFLFGVKSAPSIPLFIDNQACLSVTNHPNNSTKSRHIALREFRIRDYHELGMIRPYWCPGNYNVADFFSKLLEKGLFTMHAYRFGMNFEETIAGKLTELYQTVHLKEFTDFPKKDEKDPTTVFADIHFEKKSIAHEAYHLSHGYCQ